VVVVDVAATAAAVRATKFADQGVKQSLRQILAGGFVVTVCCKIRIEFELDLL
jgi:hypothetical protein